MNEQGCHGTAGCITAGPAQPLRMPFSALVSALDSASSLRPSAYPLHLSAPRIIAMPADAYPPAAA
jgi:hypothetical protein